MLVACRLEQYSDALIEKEGYDDLPFLQDMSPAELHEVAKAVGMKPGHAAKFVGWCPGYGRAA